MSDEKMNPCEIVYPAADYHEDFGSVLWWNFPVCEPPTLGNIDVIEGYTHFSRLPVVWDGDGKPKRERRLK